MNEQQDGLETITELPGTIRSISSGSYWSGGHGDVYFVSLSFVDKSDELRIVRFEYPDEKTRDVMHNQIFYNWGLENNRKLGVLMSAKKIEGNLYKGSKISLQR